jgi:hypothetical protein
MTTLKLFVWLLGLGLAIAALIAFQQFYVNLAPYHAEEISSLNPLQEKEFQLFLEMNHLLVTLATLAVGAIGAFIFNRYKSSKPSSYQTVLAVASWALAGFSLFAGYLAYGKVIWMLQNKFFDLSTPLVAWPNHLQFWFLIASLFFLACFLYYGLHIDVPPDPPAPVQTGAGTAKGGNP